MSILNRRGVTIAVPTIAAVVAGGAIAVAAIPDSGGQINGCYDAKGNLRVVDPAGSCANKETPLSWAQQGPKGDTGPAGPKGDTGPAGADGAQAIMIGGENLAGGRASAFLKLDGVNGESTADGHAGEIDIKSFSFDAKNTGGTSSGGGGGAGKVSISDFHFNKLYDRSSPVLFKDTATGEHIKSATFTFRRNGDNPQDFLTIKLSDVLVTGYAQGGTQEPPLLESVTLNAGKVEISFKPQNPDGSLGTPVESGWDIKSGKTT